MSDEREPCKIIAEVLKAELGLDDNHIVLDNQKLNIASDDGLFVCVSYISGKAIGVTNSVLTNEDASASEVQGVTMHSLIQIDAMSRDSSARVRKGEVIMALRSVAAARAMEAYNAQIARISRDFLNVSMLEATARLNRYTMTIAVTSMETKTKSLTDWFDTIQTPEVTANV